MGMSFSLQYLRWILHWLKVCLREWINGVLRKRNMATLLELHNLYQAQGALFARFEAAMVEAAWDVMNESPSTDNHVNRINLSKVILLGPQIPAKKYYRLLLSNATIQTLMEDSTDNDIQFVVNSLFDMIAYVEAL